MLFFRLFVSLILLVLPAANAHCQGHTALSTLESYQRASALIDAAVAAHGGVEALRAVRHMHVRQEGFDYHRNQSTRVKAPYDSTPRHIELHTDLARERLVNTQTSGYPGGFRYTNRFVSDSNRHYAVNVRGQTYTNQQYPPASQQNGNLFQVPQGMLLAALDNPASLRRYLGRVRLNSGTVVEAVTFFMPNTLVQLGFDPTTKRLRAIVSLSPDPFLGDAEAETEFFDYRMLGGVLLPTRAVLTRGGEVTRVTRYVSASTGQPIPDSLLAPQSTFTLAQPGTPDAPVRELGKGVWAIRGGGSWGMLVEFADHLMVIDAAPNAAPEIARRASSLAPGKPLRYVVPTHHHDDHFQGVRLYAATGATTVTTPGNAEYFRRIVTAPATSMGNAPAPQPSARLEVLDGKRRVFTDGSRMVEIHDIGPNAHATEMLVAWLPGEGVLFQGDLIEAPNGVAQRGANAETTMQLADFIRRQGWQVKVFGGVHGFLRDPTEFDKLVKEPMLPW